MSVDLTQVVQPLPAVAMAIIALPSGEMALRTAVFEASGRP